MQSKNPGNFDLVSGFASDLLNLFTLNNLFFFFLHVAEVLTQPLE